MHWDSVDLRTTANLTGCPNLKSLKLQRGQIFLAARNIPKDTALLLSRCTGLRRLSVRAKISNPSHYNRNASASPDLFDCSWAGLKDTLSACEQTLELLDLDYNDSYWLPSHHEKVVPIGCLNNLANLKILRAFRGVLFSEPADNYAPPITSLLPSSIEKISIAGPTIRTLEWLQELAASKHCFPNLQEVTLGLNDRRGLSHEEFVAVDREYDLSFKMNEAGIKVNLENQSVVGTDCLFWH